MRRLLWAVSVWVVAVPGAGAEPVDRVLPYHWPHDANSEPLWKRVPPPPGHQRVPVAEKSFALWLRSLPVKPGRPAVYLHTGQPKRNQHAHALVFDIDVGRRNLQQCADAVIRLRAEYLFAVERYEQICFRFTSGHKAAWTAWKAGQRPSVNHNHVTWRTRASTDGSYANFRAYLTELFRWAGSRSLARELKSVSPAQTLYAGDVFVQPGSPGHAVIVVDVAVNPQGEQAFLLAQSYMPAQDIHLLKNPLDPDKSPWFFTRSDQPLVTPEWKFPPQSVQRFSEVGCLTFGR